MKEMNLLVLNFYLKGVTMEANNEIVSDMTDKELLEFAGRAAGLEYEGEYGHCRKTEDVNLSYEKIADSASLTQMTVIRAEGTEKIGLIKIEQNSRGGIVIRLIKFYD